MAEKEYIEREATIKRFTFATLDCLGMEPQIRASDVVKAIDAIPAADVVEVVRCKDCRYYLNYNEKCELIDTRLHFYKTDKRWTEDSFCAWGERKGGDE